MRNVVLALLLLAPACALAQSAPKVEVDPKRLEVIEELSESLANDILELSVATRDRDAEVTARYFPAQIEAKPFPAEPGPVKSELKWISSHAWSAQATGVTQGTLSREEFLRGWNTFLYHFSEIEDARLKVKGATFDEKADAVLGAEVPTAIVGSTGKARIAFYVIGRDQDGRREWARGAAEVKVRYDASKHWQFDSWSLVSLDSMLAERDIFSEVSAPAGVAARLPMFGEAGNDSFVYHGASATDFNRDGWVDLFVCGAEQNYLYLNDGKGRFQDAAEGASLNLSEPCTGALALDYDNDGDEDLFLSSVGQQALLRSELKQSGKLEFKDVSVQAGIARQAIGFSAVAGDVNADGYQDIYVASYNHYGKVVPDSWYKATNGSANLLFLNQRDGTFKEEARKWGVEDTRWSYAAQFIDINDDGKQDLYVVNDFGEKALYVNKGNRFEDEASARGVLDPGNGMGVSFGDFNNDGLMDIHVTNMSSTAGNRILGRLFPNQGAKENVLKKLAAGNTLFQNMGSGMFKDVTADVGGFSAGWAWGGGFIDFDNDGWEDEYTPNGFISGKSMKDT
jgi:hypothetical protein